MKRLLAREDANTDMPEYASQTAFITPVRKALMRLGRLLLPQEEADPIPDSER